MPPRPLIVSTQLRVKKIEIESELTINMNFQLKQQQHK